MHIFLYQLLILLLLLKNGSQLTSNVNSSELGFKNYNVFRCDRDIHTRNLSRGDGVLNAVNNKLSSKLINITTKNLEIVFI